MEILIVDSTFIINNRLKLLISEANEQLIIYQAKSYKEAIQLYSEKKPAVVLLDIELPSNKSFHLLKEIKTANQKSIVIILSMEINTLSRYKYLIAGADFFLDKYHEFEKITELIQKISANYLKKVV
ncbi:MAG: response regulator [Sediminibacterium sp.]|nr:response regulator [Sediminibacterium sp.]TXT33026.1 MAG: response regulator receiver [Chitinophagaceae bacterium]